PSSTPASTLAAPAASPAATVVKEASPSAVEQAQARLQSEGSKSTLLIVSASSSGVELALYRDMRARKIRATTGPDEGIDTRGLSCFPNCVFVPAEEVNALEVDAWLAVLHHEARHAVQAANNPNMASD